MAENNGEWDLHPRRALGVALFLVFAGLVLRLLFWFQFRASDVSVLLLSESMDSFVYHGWACRIAGGDLALGDGLFTLSPFYSYLLAPIYVVAGCNMFAALFVQLLLGAAGVFFLYLAGSLIFSRLAGVAAAGMAAFYGQFVLTEGLLLSESFLPFLTAFFIWWTARALGKGRPALFLLSGFILGALFSIRPQYFLAVLLLPLFGLGAAWLRDRRDRSGRKRAAMIRILACGAAGAALAVAPLALRNLAVTGKPVLLTAAGGVNFYIGNGPEATGTWQVPEGFRATQAGMFEDFSRAANGASIDETSSYWFHRTITTIADDTGRWARLMGRKAWVFWNDFEIPVNFDFAFIREHLGAARAAFVPFCVAGALGLLGLGLALLRRRAGWLVVVTGAYFVGTILFFVSARYRMAVVPPLLLFGGYSLENAVLFFRRKQWPALAGCGLLLLLILLFTLRDVPAAVRPEHTAKQCRFMAIHFAGAGDPGRAEKWIGEAKKHDPGNALLDGDLGMILYGAGRLEEAERAIRKAIDGLPGHPGLRHLWNVLGDILERMDRRSEAEEARRMSRQQAQPFPSGTPP
jgi:4-amino-4-deoxy-L-arabinose transferase-like glycosyltransferase